MASRRDSAKLSASSFASMRSHGVFARLSRNNDKSTPSGPASGASARNEAAASFNSSSSWASSAGMVLLLNRLDHLLRRVGHGRSEEHTSELQSRLHLVC